MKIKIFIATFLLPYFAFSMNKDIEQHSIVTTSLLDERDIESENPPHMNDSFFKKTKLVSASEDDLFLTFLLQRIPVQIFQINHRSDKGPQEDVWVNTMSTQDIAKVLSKIENEVDLCGVEAIGAEVDTQAGRLLVTITYMDSLALPMSCGRNILSF